MHRIPIQLPQALARGAVVNVDYITARGLDLFTNGTGFLGNAYNLPDSFTFDPTVTPNLPGAFYYAGYARSDYGEEFLPVNPNKVYKISCALCQDSVAGDWSSYANGPRHHQYMGVACYDVDKKRINPIHHSWFRNGSVDSLTHLTAPLSPGDQVVHVDNAGGWNATKSHKYYRGITILGYKNSFGMVYDHYSRIAASDLYDFDGLDVETDTITLKAPWPDALKNPNDPNGTWPAGTRLANTYSGASFKYCAFSALIVENTDTWYQVDNHIGGIDTSGTNAANSFPPGTAYVRMVWLPNYTNRAGG